MYLPIYLIDARRPEFHNRRHTSVMNVVDRIGRRWPDWDEYSEVMTVIPMTRKARYKTSFAALVASVAAGLGLVFLTARMQLPRIAAQDFARYQWVGWHRVPPLLARVGEQSGLTF
jgi:hypothetical protein